MNACNNFNIIDFLYKINFYINKYTHSKITHPLCINDTNILVEGVNKTIKSIDKWYILSDHIDDISDMCSIEYIDHLL